MFVLSVTKSPHVHCLQGFIVSDCGAIRDLAPPFHSYTSDAVHAAADGILGGTDINCGNFYPANIPAAVTEGLLSLDDLVIAGRRFLTVALATGIFDGEDACVYSSYGPEKVDTLAHRQLAKEAALQGIALLANGVTSTPWGKAPLLPLKGSALAGKTVAVIGPNAAVTQVPTALIILLPGNVVIDFVACRASSRTMRAPTPW